MGEVRLCFHTSHDADREMLAPFTNSRTPLTVVGTSTLIVLPLSGSLVMVLVALPMVLALIPNLRRWSAKEKQDVIRIIRAQAGSDELRYLRLTQQHPRLRQEILRLGSES